MKNSHHAFSIYRYPFLLQMGVLSAVPEDLEMEEDEGSDADSFGKEFEDLLADSDDEVQFSPS